MMISNRIRGIASLTVACQCVLTLLLFLFWIVLYQLVSGARQFNLEAYQRQTDLFDPSHARMKEMGG
jgi:hypothetical protein